MSEEFRAALASSDTVAVVGVGNVAMDCARILAKGEKCQLPCMRCKFFPGDIDRHIYFPLTPSGRKHVYILRRPSVVATTADLKR